MKKILIVEDELIIRTALRKLLTRNNYDIQEAGSIAEASKNNYDNFDLIISDLRLPGSPGTDLIEAAANTPVLIMTSYASLRSAVDSMRMGAVDYIAKPFDHDEMLSAVERALSKAQQTAELSPLEVENSTYGMIGSSEVMQEVHAKIHKVSPTAATVLINGETGTGKELVARALHLQSPRKDKPLISVNCAAIPDTLIEAELFGHEKGAFTGAATERAGLIASADGGSLFLDEIGELPLEAQARLLRVLQEGEVRPIGSVNSRKVDVRLIAATHRDLSKLASEGQFREDLYFRINVVQIKLPALRERGEDINTLAEIFIKRNCEQNDKKLLKLSASATKVLQNYSWPGNIRELENAIQRAVILCEQSAPITPELLGIDLSKEKDTSQSDNSIAKNLSLEDYFQRFVLENQDSMSETELASKLGVSRKCLWERRQRLGIPRSKSNKQQS